LPQWLLKFLVPAIGALLALSAALAAACFVKAFGVTFLGRPRTQVARDAVETDRWSLAAMFGFAALCLLAGVVPGQFLDALAPVTQALVGAHLPLQEERAWLTIVPIAESRSSYSGLLLFTFIALAAWIATWVIHRYASAATRRSAPWDCGFPDASPLTQYTAGSFSQPIRRVFGSVVFRAHEEVDMPPPGDARPARFEVRMRDVPWDLFYVPAANAVAFAADHLNKVQFMSIRAYLTLLGAVPRDAVLVMQANDDSAAHFGELSAVAMKVEVAARAGTASTAARAHLTARAGPSNVAKKPSPAVSISTPR